MKGHGTVRHSATGDIAARVEALVKNQQLIDEELSQQHQAIDRLEVAIKEGVEGERRERVDADKNISDQLERAIIGGLHLEFAGVAFLIIGIAFTSIPNRVASALQIVGL